MFTKAKRFDPLALKTQTAGTRKPEVETKLKLKVPAMPEVETKPKPKVHETPSAGPKKPEVETKPKLKVPETPAAATKKPEVETKPKPKVPAMTAKDPKINCPKAKLKSVTTPVKPWDTHSQGSSIKSTKSFVTPRPVKVTPKPPTSLKKEPLSSKLPICKKNQTKHSKTAQEEIFKAQEVEIRNKDFTIEEYNKQIEELKHEIATLNTILQQTQTSDDVNKLDQKLSEFVLNDESSKVTEKMEKGPSETEIDNNKLIEDFKLKIIALEHQCEDLEQEVSGKQVDLQSLEEIITIRDTFCKDLQDKLTYMETTLEETKQRLEMVKGHHALALEANESIRREYKAELETIKNKFEDEKLLIIARSKADQEIVKQKYISQIESIKNKLIKEKEDAITDLEQQLATKEHEMKAKLEQINEATEEKLRLCEIQFEERTQNIQDHCNHQEQQVKYLEKETKDLKHSVNVTEEFNMKLQSDINYLKNEIDILKSDKHELIKETDELKEEAKKKLIDFENEKNKLIVEVDKANKEKHKFEMSLSVTRDIVQVLTMRLRESDNELEHLENDVLALTESKQKLENELSTLKNTFNKTMMECSEYKDALVNIVKSKAALAKEHNRMMEHNVTLIESLQNVEKEAYRELGSIKNEMIEDVELLKKESNSQIQMLRDEVEQKRVLCELATAHAGQATAAAEQSRVLLATAAQEIDRLKADNFRLKQQIQDQQSLVVELSLLRQENEELMLSMAKQSSIVDKMKKDAESVQIKPKSPLVTRKSHKTGKENLQVVVSPLRERNH